MIMAQSWFWDFLFEFEISLVTINIKGICCIQGSKIDSLNNMNITAGKDAWMTQEKLAFILTKEISL